MKLFLSFFLLCSLTSINAQVGGEAVYQFLNLPTSARQVALGGEVLTLIDDVNQPIYNPSTIRLEMDNQLSVNYTSYLAGINIGSIAYAKQFSKKLGTFHGNVQYLNYGSLIGADEAGNETGNFNASDVAISVGYAIPLPLKDIYFGANLKFINSSIQRFSSTAIASDFSLLYFNPEKPFVFTLVARNVGTQLKSFETVTEKLPFKVAFGASYQLQYVPLKWYATFDNLQKWDLSVPNPSNQTVDLNGNVTNEEISFVNNLFRHVIIGAELFPKSAINLRIGYNFRRGQELALQNARSFSGISFGFGIKMNKFKLNYGYSKVHTASNVSTFSLQIDLDKKKDE